MSALAALTLPLAAATPAPDPVRQARDLRLRRQREDEAPVAEVTRRRNRDPEGVDALLQIRLLGEIPEAVLRRMVRRRVREARRGKTDALRPRDRRGDRLQLPPVFRQDVGVLLRHFGSGLLDAVDEPDLGPAHPCEGRGGQMRVERARRLAPEVVRTRVRLVQKPDARIAVVRGIAERTEDVRDEIRPVAFAVAAVADAHHRNLPPCRDDPRQGPREERLLAGHADAGGDRRIDRIERVTEAADETVHHVALDGEEDTVVLVVLFRRADALAHLGLGERRAAAAVELANAFRDDRIVLLETRLLVALEHGDHGENRQR